MSLEWMVWTGQTAAFFVMIAGLLVAMTVWEVVQPNVPRRGLLRLTTTRGDRFFIGLLGSAYIHLGWLGLTDWSLWFASALSVAWLVAVLRWG